MTPRIVVANLGVRLKSFYRERSAMFFTFAFPVILVLVFGTIFTKPEHLNLDLQVQDNSGSKTSAKLLEALAAGEGFKITSVPAAVDATAYAKEHGLNLLLVIPKNFEALQVQRAVGPLAGVPVSLEYIYDPSSTAVDTKIRLLEAIVAAANQKATGSPPSITLAATSILTERYRFIEFFVPGIIAMAIMTSCLSNALNMNAELRQKGILRKLATTPITRADWLASSILYQLILSVISTVAILVVSYFVFDVRLHIGFWLPLIVVVEVIAFTGIGMLLTPFAKEAESASAVANAFLFPMMFLSGTFFPVEMMPAFLQAFAKVLPLYYVNEALRAAMIFVDDAATLRAVGVTAAFAAVVFVAGTFRTRWDEAHEYARTCPLRGRADYATAEPRAGNARAPDEPAGGYRVSGEKRILFICGSMNQTTQMHQISRHLTGYMQAFTPFYCDGVQEAMRRLNLLEFTIIGAKLAERCDAYLRAANLAIDYQGQRGPYDLVVTCSDVFVQKNIRGNRIVLVQEGITDPENAAFRLVQRHRSLPLWLAGTAATGLSDAYRAFCVASDGYRDFFVANGAKAAKIVVTGIPNFDDCERYRDNTFPHHHYVLVCTSPLRELFRKEDRPSLIRNAVGLANGRPMIFKFHPNEDLVRAEKEVREFAPGAMTFSDGSAEEMIANCDVLITRYSSTVFVGLALHKETYSDFPAEDLHRLLPLQNNAAAANIAGVCRRVIADQAIQ